MSNCYRYVLAVLACVPTLGCGEAPVPTEPARSARADDASALSDRLPFVGAWSLATIERRSAEGELLSPPIEDRLGYIIYDAAGFMGVTIMRPGRMPYTEDGPTADEALAQFGSYTSYFGRFTVDPAQGTVTHHVEGSLNPNGAGSDYERVFTFSEDRLILQPPSGEDRSKTLLSWERLPAMPLSEVTDTHRLLFGAYRVESVTRHTTDGYSLPVDQYESAYILYAPSGYMSVHLMRPGRAAYAGDQPTAEEALRTTETYGSYFGPFSVHEVEGCITCPGPRDQGYVVHHRVGSENPGDSGTDARRYYELTDTHLTLRPPPRQDDEGRQVITALRWARLSSAVP